MNDNGTGQDLGATGQGTSRCLILRLRQFVAWGLLTLCSGAAGMIVDVAQAGEVAATSAAASTSGAGGAGNSAATSAALLSSAAQKAPAIPPVPLADVPAMATPAAIAGSEDATGKPPAPGKGQASAQAESTKKRKVAHGRRKTKEPVLADTPVMIQPEPPSLLDALFGNSQDLPPVAATADPAVTAATDALGADVSKQKGKGKGSKIAKNTILPSNATGQPLPDVDLFGSENAPFATGELGYPLMSPGNVDPLKAAIKRYADIVANGGWPTVSPLQMQVGTNNAAVAELRRRLKIEGDLKGDPSGFSGPSYFDQEVSDALKSFQSRYGLGETGDLMDSDRLKNGTRTVIALNVPAEARLAQLKANLARFQSKTIGKGRYVVVNIPGEQIEAVDGNRVVLRLNGVVGRPERPSPLLSSSIEEIKFNPLWTMPPTVVREDLIPKGQSLQAKGQDVLSKFGIDAYDGNGKKVDSSKIKDRKSVV